MLRLALYQGHTLWRAIQGLNDVLVKHNLLQGFATLFVGLYDIETGVLTYVSCGHETALLRRHGSNVVEELEPNSPIVGAFADAEFLQQTVIVEPGDALLMFTDGLSEAGRSRHDFLGVDGLVALVKNVPQSGSAADYIDWIIHGVEAHNRGTFHDDRCLVAAVMQGK
jgi:sigma-B regulation protein RsbU (phosphoserine phosphatase)